MTITKEASGDGTIGISETVLFSINVTNETAQAIQNVRVVDDYDQAVFPTIAGINDNQQADGIDDGDVIIWQVDKLEPQVPWVINYEATTAEVFVPGTADVSNIATVFIDGEKAAQDSVVLGIRKPQLTVAKTVDGPGIIGPSGESHFTILVKNEGTTAANNVIVVDDYDQQAWQAIKNIQVLFETDVEPASVLNDGDTIRWEIGTLNPGEVWSASYDATAVDTFAVETTQVSNTVSVFTGAAQIAQDVVTLEVQAPQLTLTRENHFTDGEDEIMPGDTVRVAIRYSNGPSELVGVIVKEILDGRVLQVIEGSISEPGELLSSSEIQWSLGDLAPGTSGVAEYEFAVRPTIAEGNIEVKNVASISAPEVPPVSVSDTYTVKTPLLVIDKPEVHDINGGAIEPGDILRVTIEIHNSGEAPASDLVARSEYDTQIVETVISSSDDELRADEGNEIVWRLGEALAAGDDKLFSYKVQLRDDIDEETEGVFKASIGIDEIQVVGDDRAITVVTGNGGPDIIQSSQADKVLDLITKMVLGTFLLIFLMVALLLWREKWETRYFGNVIEGITIVVIVGAVLLLSISTGGIDAQGTVSILSAIVGYVLGRSTTELAQLVARSRRAGTEGGDAEAEEVG